MTLFFLILLVYINKHIIILPCSPPCLDIWKIFNSLFLFCFPDIWHFLFLPLFFSVFFSFFTIIHFCHFPEGIPYLTDTLHYWMPQTTSFPELPCIFKSEERGRTLAIWEHFSLFLPGCASLTDFCPKLFFLQTFSKWVRGPVAIALPCTLLKDADS